MSELLCAWCQNRPYEGWHQNYPICSVCYTAQTAPQLPSLGVYQPYDQDHRYCFRCSAVVSNRDKCCPNCQFVELSLVETLREEEPAVFRSLPLESAASNPCWKCSSCSYEYNLESICGRCKTVKNSAHFQREEAGNYKLASGRSMWKCSQGHDFNLYTDCICRECEEPHLHTVGRRDASWTCFHCTTRNQGLTCIRCSFPRSWKAYLCKEGLLISEQETMWVCSKCKSMNGLTVATCTHCKMKTVKAIAKWTQPESAKPWYAFLCCG